MGFTDFYTSEQIFLYVCDTDYANLKNRNTVESFTLKVVVKSVKCLLSLLKNAQPY